MCSNCFKALGVHSKMEIYKFIAKNKKACVSDVVKKVKLTQPTVSHHLKDMQKAGLLNSTKVGKEKFYSVNTRCQKYKHNCLLGKLEF